MIEEREFSVTDHRAKMRRRFKVIAIPLVLAPLVGFLISYAFTAEYTSQSLILLKTNSLPQGQAQPLVLEDASQYIWTLGQQVLSQNRFQPMIDRMGLATGGRSVEQVVKDISQNTRIEPVVTNLSQSKIVGGETPQEGSNVAGFYVEYTGSTPKQAQQICGELTSMLLEEDLHARTRESASRAESQRQLDEAKHNLEEQENKLVAFKKQHTGQRPGDSESNTTMVMALNAQLNGLSQWIDLTQQNKSNTESILAQQPANQKSAPTPAAVTALEKQLSDLESQLLQLQAQYTDDHPDVVKTKADIREIKKKLAEANAADGAGEGPNAKPNVEETPEIHRLRLQIEQYDEAIAKATREQKSIQEQIKLYQGRILLSSSAEEQYQQLTEDYDTAQGSYADLLAKNGGVGNGIGTGGLPPSERIRLLNPANLPVTPRFPDRRLFAAGGLGSGLALGLGIALWLEMRDRAIRPKQYW